MRLAHPLAALVAVAAAGCLGSYTPGKPGSSTPGTPGSTTPGTGANAVALFIANVQPFVSTECASCHATDQPNAGPKFLGASGAYYGQLIADPRFVNATPAQSYLIVHRHQPGPGQGVDPSAMQAQAIVDWITQENQERLLPAAPPSAMVPLDELAKFGKCMSLTDYNSSGMNNIWKTVTNGNTGPCNSCHQNGEHQVMLSVDANRNFAALSDVRHLLRLAVADVKADGTLNDIVAAKRFYLRGQEVGHPQFPPTNVQTPVDTFFQLTYAKYKAGTCP